MTQELEPYIVVRPQGSQAEFAMWQLATGPQALALFQSAERASTYQQTAQLSADWQVFQPTRDGLLQLLRHCQGEGIEYAVLDPDVDQAQQVLEIGQMLQQGPRPSAEQA